MSRRAALTVALVLAAAGLAVSAAGASPAKHAAARLEPSARRHQRRGRHAVREPGDGLPGAQGAQRQGAPREPLLGRDEVGGVAWREADRPDRSGRSRLRLVALRPSHALRGDLPHQGRVLGPVHSLVGERREGANGRADEREGAPGLRVRGGCPLQRLLRSAELAAAADAREPDGAASGGDVLDRLERAEQPGLPLAAVRAPGRQVGRRERDPVREDLQRRLCGHPRGRHLRREGRLRRHRAEGQRRTHDVAPLRRPALVPRGREEGRDEEVRRVRASPVLRAGDGVAVVRAERQGGAPHPDGQHRRPPRGDHEALRAASTSGSPSTATRRIRRTTTSACRTRTRRRG